MNSIPQVTKGLAQVICEAMGWELTLADFNGWRFIRKKGSPLNLGYGKTLRDAVIDALRSGFWHSPYMTWEGRLTSQCPPQIRAICGAKEKP